LRAHSEVTWAQGCTVNRRFDASFFTNAGEEIKNKKEVNPVVIIPPKEIAGKEGCLVFIMHK
jgi:hypothetical protein